MLQRLTLTRASCAGDRSPARRVIKQGARGALAIVDGRCVRAPAPYGRGRRHDRRRRRLQRRVPGGAARRAATWPRACGLGVRLGSLSTRAAGGIDGLPLREELGRLGREQRKLDLAVKIAVIGGAGVRVPLLVNGLASAGLRHRRVRALRPGSRCASAVIGRAGRAPRRNGARDHACLGRAGHRRRAVSSSPASASAASRRGCTTSGRRSPSGSSDRRRSGRAASPWRCGPFRRSLAYARAR